MLQSSAGHGLEAKEYGILIDIKWPGVLKEDHFEIVRRSTFVQLPHWTTVITTSVRIKNQKLSVPDFQSLRSLANVFFLLHEPQGKWSLRVFMNHRKSNMRSLYDVTSLEFSFCDSVLYAVHYGSFQFTEKSRNKNFTIFQKNSKEIN